MTDESTAKFDRADLVRGWREYEAQLPRLLPVLKYAAKTDMGQVRENNEDKFDYYEPEDPAVLAARGSFYAVADGIGGAMAGQIASEMMLKNVIAGYYDNPEGDIETALHTAIHNANERVYGVAQMIPERSGMGTTLVGAVFVEDRIVLAQVGDSRVYLVRDNTITQVTRDHSWVEEQVQAGAMSREDAERSPYRNVITRSIGASPNVQPDFYHERAQIGDVWVLCSDGLTGHVADGEIGQIAIGNAPSEAARQLIELANARGGRDNITVFVIAVRGFMPPAPLGISSETSDGASAYSEIGTKPLNSSAAPVSNGSEVAGSDFVSTFHAVGQAANQTDSASQPRGVWNKLFGR